MRGVRVTSSSAMTPRGQERTVGYQWAFLNRQTSELRWTVFVQCK